MQNKQRTSQHKKTAERTASAIGVTQNNEALISMASDTDIAYAVENGNICFDRSSKIVATINIADLSINPNKAYKKIMVNL